MFVFLHCQAGVAGLYTSSFMAELSSTHIFAFAVFTVDVLWRKLPFLSLFHFADDGSDTGAHAVRAQGQCSVSCVIDSSVNSNVINIARISSV